MEDRDLDFLPERLGAYIDLLAKETKESSQDDRAELKNATAIYRKLKKTQKKLVKAYGSLNKTEKEKSGIKILGRKLNEFLSKRRAKKITNLTKEITDLSGILEEVAKKANKLMEKVERVVEKKMPWEEETQEVTSNQRQMSDEELRREQAKETILGQRFEKQPEAPDLITFGDPTTLKTPNKQVVPEPPKQSPKEKPEPSPEPSPIPIPEKPAPPQVLGPKQKKVTVQGVIEAVLDPEKTDQQRENILRTYLSMPGATKAVQDFVASSLEGAQKGSQKLLGDDRQQPAMPLGSKQRDMLIRALSAVWENPGTALAAVTAFNEQSPIVGRMLMGGGPAAGPKAVMPQKGPPPETEEMTKYEPRIKDQAEITPPKHDTGEIAIPSSPSKPEGGVPKEEQQGWDDAARQTVKATGNFLQYYTTGWGSTSKKEENKPTQTPTSPATEKSEHKAEKKSGWWPF